MEDEVELHILQSFVSSCEQVGHSQLQILREREPPEPLRAREFGRSGRQSCASVVDDFLALCVHLGHELPHAFIFLTATHAVGQFVKSAARRHHHFVASDVAVEERAAGHLLFQGAQVAIESHGHADEGLEDAHFLVGQQIFVARDKIVEGEFLESFVGILGIGEGLFKELVELLGELLFGHQGPFVLVELGGGAAAPA